MEKLGQLFTLGIWHVRPGKEDTFIAEWKSFAEWSSRNQSGSGTGYLLRDDGQPQTFISFGAWESPEDITVWRSSAEFQSFAAKAKLLCESFVPHAMKLVATSEG